MVNSPFLSSKLSERSFVGVKRLLTELLMPEKSMYFAGCLAFLLGLSPSKACPSSETCPVDPAECELRIAEGAKCQVPSAKCQVPSSCITPRMKLGHITWVINAFHRTAPVNLIAAAFAHLLPPMTSSCTLCRQATARLQCSNNGSRSKATYSRRPCIVHAVEASGR